jgi:NADH-quinone oxidoreductase subunit L
MSLILISVAFAFAGIFVAYFVYVLNPGSADGYARSLGGVYRAIAGKFFVDEAYDAAIVHPLEQGSRAVLMNGFEEVVVEGGVNATVAISRWSGGFLRLLQAGNIRSYAVYILLGAVIFLGVMAANGGAR